MATKSKAKTPDKVASLLYDEMDEGGGLLNDIRATITKAEFVMTDYGGRAKMGKKPAAHLVLEEPDGTVHDDQWWTCGKTEDWVPSEDGHFLVPMGLKNQINKKSFLGRLLGSVMEQGFPKDKVSADIAFLEGLEAHWRQQSTGRKTQRDGKDTEYDETVLCVAQIFKYPWEKKSGGGGGKKSTSSGSKSAAKSVGSGGGGGSGDAGGGGNAEDVVTGFILGKIVENPDGIAKADMPKMLMDNAKEMDWDVKLVQGMISAVFNPAWSESDERPWVVDGGFFKSAA
jgi:hypothetical protein